MSCKVCWTDVDQNYPNAKTFSAGTQCYVKIQNHSVVLEVKCVDV